MNNLNISWSCYPHGIKYDLRYDFEKRLINFKDSPSMELPNDYKGNVNAQLSDHNDIFHGSDYDDHIFGEKGNDIIYGHIGNDKLFGEEGDDVIYGGLGKDLIKGGNGNDTIYAGDGNDIIINITNLRSPHTRFDGNDIVYGGAGDDILYVHSGMDIVYGEEGNDYLVNLWGDGSTLVGGKGIDRIGNQFNEGINTTFVLEGDVANVSRTNWISDDRVTTFKKFTGDVDGDGKQKFHEDFDFIFNLKIGDKIKVNGLNDLGKISKTFGQFFASTDSGGKEIVRRQGREDFIIYIDNDNSNGFDKDDTVIAALHDPISEFMVKLEDNYIEII